MDILNNFDNSQILSDDILYELEKIHIKPIKKRLINELIVLKNKNAYIHLEYINNNNNLRSTNFIIIVTIIFSKDNNIYQFEISENYPFRPPKFRINYKPYKSYLMINSIKTKNELFLYTGLNCLCCYSYSCPENWNFMLKFENFINQFNVIKKYRKMIINRIIIQKILNKYLISDINLDVWLH
jgi:hypothetical protein